VCVALGSKLGRQGAKEKGGIVALGGSCVTFCKLFKACADGLEALDANAGVCS